MASRLKRLRKKLQSSKGGARIARGLVYTGTGLGAFFGGSVGAGAGGTVGTLLGSAFIRPERRRKFLKRGIGVAAIATGASAGLGALSGQGLAAPLTTSLPALGSKLFGRGGPTSQAVADLPAEERKFNQAFGLDLATQAGAAEERAAGGGGGLLSLGKQLLGPDGQPTDETGGIEGGARFLPGGEFGEGQAASAGIFSNPMVLIGGAVILFLVLGRKRG